MENGTGKKHDHTARSGEVNIIIGQHTEKEQIPAKEQPETYMLKLPVRGVFYEGGLTGTRIPLSGRGLARYKNQIQSFLQDMGGHGSRHPTDSGRLLEGIPEPETREKIEWTDISVSLEGNSLYGWLKIQTKARLSESERKALSSCVEQKFTEGWGGQFSDSRTAVAGGCLRFWFEPPKDFMFMIQKKYKVTQISHPQYPWIYRIQALKTVNGRVGAGTLGGFVQSEGNMSQEGACWIYDDAVSYDDAVVEQRNSMMGLRQPTSQLLPGMPACMAVPGPEGTAGSKAGK